MCVYQRGYANRATAGQHGPAWGFAEANSSAATELGGSCGSAWAPTLRVQEKGTTGPGEGTAEPGWEQPGRDGLDCRTSLLSGNGAGGGGGAGRGRRVGAPAGGVPKAPPVHHPIKLWQVASQVQVYWGGGHQGRGLQQAALRIGQCCQHDRHVLLEDERAQGRGRGRPGDAGKRARHLDGLRAGRWVGGWLHRRWQSPALVGWLFQGRLSGQAAARCPGSPHHPRHHNTLPPTNT